MIRPSPPSAGPPRPPLPLAAALYTVLALAVTWPAVLRPGSWLIGHQSGDQWQNLWGYGWVRESVLAGRFPLRVDQLGHPDGGWLFYLDLLDALFGMPLEPWLGPVATYNLLVWFNMVLGAVGAFVLVRHLTRNAGGALLGGLIYGFSPYLLSAVANGSTETLTIGWLPLFLHQLLRLGETGRWRHAAGAAAMATACLLGCLYHGVMAAMAGALIVGYGLVLRRPRWPLSRLAGLAAVGAIAGAVVLFQHHELRRAEDSPANFAGGEPAQGVRGADPDWRTRSLVTDPVNLLLPGKPVLPERSLTNIVNHVTYLGWLVLVLAGFGVWGGRRAAVPAPADGDLPLLAGRRERLFWLGLALVFCVLSLGINLRWAGKPVFVGGHPLFLPGAALDALLPVLAAGESKYRLVLVVELGLAVLAGWGWSRLAARLGRSAARGALAGIAVALLAETALLSPALVPVPGSHDSVPAYCRELADDPDPGAVFDLPFHSSVRVFGRYVYLAGIHGKPIPYIFQEALPRSTFRVPAVAELVDWSRGLAGERPLPAALRESPFRLAEIGFSKLIVHIPLAEDLALNAATLQRALDLLEDRLGHPERDDGEVQVYLLDRAQGVGEATE
jgi:hypothetical protein